MSVRRRRPTGLPALLLWCFVGALVLTASPSPAVAAGGPTASTSSNAPGASATALVDGDGGSSGTAAEWSAAPGVSTAWAQLAWTAPRRLSSVQFFGPSQEAFDPKQSTAAALHGHLLFSDGSSVVVSGIAGGAGLPTTVAFSPRTVSWVRVALERTVPNAVLGLREMAAYDAGQVPPQPSGPAPSYAVTPNRAASCDRSSSPVGSTANGDVALVCPSPGTVVNRTATIVVAAPAGAPLVVSVWRARRARQQTGPLATVATATADGSGRAVFIIRTRLLPAGPMALRVTRADRALTAQTPLYVQLLHLGGMRLTAPDPAPANLSLVYSDDFKAPLSVSGTGAGAAYAAVKPEPWGGSQFGDAVFADPSWGADTLSSVDGYLRIRAQPIGSLAKRATWGQKYASGIISSQRFGGSGFSAQYAYFEARMLGAPGPGAWPALWMMNSEAGTGRAAGSSGELDAVELYGHDTGNSCHTTHQWGGGDGGLKCLDAAQPADWAMSWHTYGAQVVPGGAVFFIDGVEVARLDGLSHTDEPFFFMIDLALGGGWPVDLSRTGDTTDLYVDWVRVYT